MKQSGLRLLTTAGTVFGKDVLMPLARGVMEYGTGNAGDVILKDLKTSLQAEV